MARRLRPTRIEHVVDGVKLRAQLSAAALDALGDAGEQRKRALELLRAALFRGRMIAKERLEAGAGGVETARLLCKVADEVISALYDFTTVHVFRARNPTEGERLALMAVGGYGRGSLAPFSDVDLLFLRPYKQTPHVESVIEFMLYALWDLGFKVGHASRTVEECLRLSREDYTIRTSLLEARLLTGDTPLADELRRRFRKEFQSGPGADFVAAKLAERDERHAKAGATRYLVEPNVKEGKGGLRDLNTLFWIARYLHRSDDVEEVLRLDMFDGHDRKVFARAFDFLWAVRAHLHFATGRAEERLSFDLQPEIARRMGYARPGLDGGAPEPAVERFMRRYFLIAREVGALTRTFCAKLEGEHAKLKPPGLSRFLPGRGRTRRTALEDGFLEEGGRLTVAGPETFADDPVNLLRLFRVADRRDLDLHPDAFFAVAHALPLVTAKVRRDKEAAAVFLDILAHGRKPYRTLTLMNEAGVLGRYLPEFGGIVAQMQFNMYHSYTVDEHTLRAVGLISDLAHGRLGEDHPLSVEIMPLIDDLEVLFLAMLLHDTGKGGEGGQSLAGAKTARAACERLGLSTQRVDLVAWLVEHHLVMSDVAQKRDISDPRTIADFAGVVRNVGRLRMLLVLTVADIRAVGPGVWNGWKGQLLRDLYGATESYLAGDGAEERRRRADAARQVLIDAAPDPAAARRWAEDMDDAYFNAFDPEEHLHHLEVAARAAAEGGAAATQARGRQRTLEVAVAASDRPGLFADLAGCFADLGASVLGARGFTSAEGKVLDIFQIQDASGAPFGEANGAAAQRLAACLTRAARAPIPRPDAPAQGLASGRAAVFTVPAHVAIDNDASETATVIEVSGLDRPGLLEALARTLSEAGLQILSAHVESYGERAEDAFYVCERRGGKLLRPRRIAVLKTALKEVLSVDPAARVPRRLERALASAGR